MKNVRLHFVILLVVAWASGIGQAKLETTLIKDIELELADSLGGYSGITLIKEKNWDDGVDFVMISDGGKGKVSPHMLWITLKIDEERLGEKDLNPKKMTLYDNPEMAPESIRFRNGIYMGTSEGKSSYWKKVWFLYPQRKAMSFTPIGIKQELNSNSGFEAFDVQSTGVWWVGLERQNDEPPFENPCPNSEPIKTILLISSMGSTLTYEFQLDPDSISCRHGLSDMLFYDNSTLITLERRWEPEKENVLAGLYQLNIKTKTYDPLLLINSKVKRVDNLEGMTWGPGLTHKGKSYERTLIIVADNNFSENQKNQLLIFGINEN